MRLLVSGSTRSMREVASRWPDILGHLLTPSNRNSPATTAAAGLPWAADNGAFSGLNEHLFRAMLRKISGLPGCLFVVVPDVVADARGTLESFDRWQGEVRSCGQPLAFVGQNGAEDMELPWDAFDAWFVGGCTEWKLSRASAELCAEAKRRGKHVHMGRVNSRKRMRIAADFGCDSIDGTSASMFGDTYIEKFCGWIEQIKRQEVLF